MIEDIIINGRRLGKFITPPRSADPKLNSFLNDYTIARERTSEYLPRTDCPHCMKHYDLAKSLNQIDEKVVLLVKRIPLDPIGDIIGIELI